MVKNNSRKLMISIITAIIVIPLVLIGSCVPLTLLNIGSDGRSVSIFGIILAIISSILIIFIIYIIVKIFYKYFTYKKS